MFNLNRQYDSNDCGIACVKMICEFYGYYTEIDSLRNAVDIGVSGLSLAGINRVFSTVGLDSIAIRSTLSKLNDIGLPSIALLKSNHYVVINKVSKAKVTVFDPSIGTNVSYIIADFTELWDTVDKKGIAIVAQPNVRFIKNKKNRPNWDFISFTKKYNYEFLLIALSFIGYACINLIIPFFTKSIIDKAIPNSDLNYLWLILLGYFFLKTGEVANSYYQLKLSINISKRLKFDLSNYYLSKLFRLPIKFFEGKRVGNIIERVRDISRIQDFLTNSMVEFLLGLILVVAYGIFLYSFNVVIFLVFFVGSFFYVLWMFLFYKERGKIDKQEFDLRSSDYNMLTQTMAGIKDIRSLNAEDYKLKQWESIQLELFDTELRKFKVNQKQKVGSDIIDNFKNLIIIGLGASSVINNSMSVGEMFALQFILGQLNVPIYNLSYFLNSAQDAFLSYSRASSIMNLVIQDKQQKRSDITISNDIVIRKLSFKYDGVENCTLKNLNITIPMGKTTAIVGLSGCGKTTLFKILIKLYDYNEGEILINGTNLRDIDEVVWRSMCSSVLQEGFVFNDTILGNITMGNQGDEEIIDAAIKMANLEEFVNQLPLGLKTQIGEDGGVSLSTGQKQRVLIARAFYNPRPFILLDEATNSLDTYNESIISENIDKTFKNSTVLIIAHRLSTIKNADTIAVMDEGSIIAQGNHDYLTEFCPLYNDLIKNQMNLECQVV